MRLTTAFAVLSLALSGCVRAVARKAEPGALEQRKARAEEWYHRTSDGVQLYVYEIGRATAPGHTIVVLHGGWGAEHSYLLDAVTPLAGHYRFVLYDQRGSLRSPAPDSSLSLDRMVADLEELRRALDMERVTLLAHSQGNALAYAYLAQHPDRVRGLVLMDAVLPAPSGQGPPMPFIRQVWSDADSARLAAASAAFFSGAWARAKAIQLREGLIPDSLRAVPPERLDLLSVLRDRAYTRAWRISFAAVNTCTGERWREMKGGQAFFSARVARAMSRDSTVGARSLTFWPALAAFAGPVRVIMGSCDYVDVGPAVWPHIIPRLHDGRLRVVSGGHASWMEDPRGFRDALTASLAEATRP